jgi:hypothetical protein
MGRISKSMLALLILMSMGSSAWSAEDDDLNEMLA